MLISVIIPYYNNSNEILRCLKSVLTQTCQNFEILVINDASPDWSNALPTIQDLSDARIQTLSHTSNKNGSAARNTGIKKAKGDYIAFLDADDEWCENHLQDSLKYIQQHNCDLVSSKVKIINSKGVFYSPKVQKHKNDSVATYLFSKGMVMFTPSLFCKTELAKTILFDEEIRRHQDFDFLLRAEQNNYILATSSHIGAIVHWENNNPIKKGETWEFSSHWLRNRKGLLSKNEYDNFWLQFIGFKIIAQSKRLFIKEFFKNKINPFHLNKSRVKVLFLKFL